MTTAKQTYIASTVFRNYINLFSKLMDLPQTAMLNVNGVAKEHTVFHRMELLNYGSNDTSLAPTLSIRSYAIKAVSDEAAEVDTVDIVPEYEFTQDSIFWAGAPQKVFRDFSPLNDKKYGSLSFCASYERDLYYPIFAINEGSPIFTMQIALAMLDRLEVPEEKRVKVGEVTEDGTFIPAKTLTATDPVKHVSKLAAPIARVTIQENENSGHPAVWTSGRQPVGLMHRAMTTLSHFAMDPSPMGGALLSK